MDIKEKKLPKLLMFQDRCSMNSSVESRVNPFLDHELYEMARNISIEHHINNGNLKSILSAELNNNKKNIEKKYVAAPQREWLKKDLYNTVKEIIFPWIFG